MFHIFTRMGQFLLYIFVQMVFYFRYLEFFFSLELNFENLKLLFSFINFKSSTHFGVFIDVQYMFHKLTTGHNYHFTTNNNPCFFKTLLIEHSSLQHESTHLWHQNTSLSFTVVCIFFFKSLTTFDPAPQDTTHDSGIFFGLIIFLNSSIFI